MKHRKNLIYGFGVATGCWVGTNSIVMSAIAGAMLTATWYAADALELWIKSMWRK